MIAADVLVLGAGPAGAVAALNLAPFHRVIVLERGVEPTRRGGESLPAAVCRLLGDMGLWPAFLRSQPEPAFARASHWGGPDQVEVESLKDPDGPGWHVDRARFDVLLRTAAAERGAVVLTSAHPAALSPVDDGWDVAVALRGKRVPVRASFLIDARGRAARPLPGCGAKRTVHDRLVCGWIERPSGSEDGESDSAFALTEAEEEGWWYGAPMPNGRRLLAFYTDANLPAAADAASVSRLLSRAARRTSLRLGEPSTDDRHGYCAAHGACLEPAGGRNWLAVGDAAAAFDPLSSQGGFNALFTGLAAAEAVHRVLKGDSEAVSGYVAQLSDIWATYCRHRAIWYGLEQRWRAEPFWLRRHLPGAGMP